MFQQYSSDGLPGRKGRNTIEKSSGTSYVYETADASVTLAPRYVYSSAVDSYETVITAEQVGSEWIALLNEYDGELRNEKRRNSRLAPVHYDSFFDSVDAADSNPYLADYGMEPLRFLIKKFDEERKLELVREMKAYMAELTPLQQSRLIKLARGRKVAAIARSENVDFNTVKESVESALKKLRRKLKSRPGGALKPLSIRAAATGQIPRKTRRGAESA